MVVVLAFASALAASVTTPGSRGGMALAAAAGATRQLAAGAGHDRAGLSLEVTPSRVVLGDSGATSVTITVRLPPASARAGLAALRLDTTAGRVTGLRALGDGRFEAKLEPPAERYPQYAVVSAADVSAVDASEPPPVRVAVVAYAARLELKGKSDPNARLVVQIGPNRFGPASADDQGRFVVPVVVEPGQAWGWTTATDALGNTSRSRTNLYLPAVQRLHAFVWPEALVADGRDRGYLYVTSLGQSGAPEEAAVVARVSAGSLGPAERVGPGLTRLAITAPGQARGPIRLELAAPRLRASSALDVPLLAGAPAALEVSARPEPAPADGRTPTTIEVTARDAAGNPAGGHRLLVVVDGVEVPVHESPQGTYEAEVSPRGAAGRARAKVRLEPVAATCPRPVGVVTDGRLEIRDRRGIPCGGSVTVIDPDRRERWRADIESRGERRGVELRGALAPADLVVLTDGAGREQLVRIGTAAADASPLEGDVDLAWRVPAPPELELTVVDHTGGLVRLRLAARGITDLASRARIEAAGASVRQIGQGQGTVDYAVRPAGKGPVDVVATDGETGVSAWLRLD